MSSTCFESEGSSSGRRLYMQLWYSVLYMVWYSVLYMVWHSVLYMVWYSVLYMVWHSVLYVVWHSVLYMVWYSVLYMHRCKQYSETYRTLPVHTAVFLNMNHRL